MRLFSRAMKTNSLYSVREILCNTLFWELKMSKKMEKKRSCLEYNPNQTFQNKFPFYLHANIDTLKLNWLLREAACSQTSNTISLRHSMVDNWNSHVHWLIVLSIYKGHTLFVCMIICLTTQSSCYSLLTCSWTTITVKFDSPITCPSISTLFWFQTPHSNAFGSCFS